MLQVSESAADPKCGLDIPLTRTPCPGQPQTPPRAPSPLGESARGAPQHPPTRGRELAGLLRLAAGSPVGPGVLYPGRMAQAFRPCGGFAIGARVVIAGT